jgi:hypothetical protein
VKVLKAQPRKSFDQQKPEGLEAHKDVTDLQEVVGAPKPEIISDDQHVAS